MFWVYVIRNEVGVLYKGITDDLNRRMKQHNGGESRWTSSRGPWELVYTESVDTRQQAREREKYLKSGVGREYLKEVIK